MTGRIHVWPEDRVRARDGVTAGITVEGLGHGRLRLWYRVPAAYEYALSSSDDPFVVALLFSAMRRGTDLHVHGQLSPSLLRNLDEFQSAWARWRLGHYVKVGISADVEREAAATESDAALTLFSGGVDSSFTARRHRERQAGRSTLPVAAGLMVHGFDIPLANEPQFERAAAKAAKILASLGLDLVRMSTNLRELETPWWDFHGAAGASSLMLLAGGFRTGLVPSTDSYDDLILPWGTNAVTDPMMSSDSFRLVHDGASFSRIEKVRALGDWPEALRHLRVCLEGNQGREDENCNACEKCIRTVLAFRVCGAGLPGAFARDVTNRQILAMARLDAIKLVELQRIVDAARRAPVRASWVRALQASVARNRLALTLRRARDGFERAIRDGARTLLPRRASAALRRAAAALG